MVYQVDTKRLNPGSRSKRPLGVVNREYIGRIGGSCRSFAKIISRWSVEVLELEENNPEPVKKHCVTGWTIGNPNVSCYQAGVYVGYKLVFKFEPGNRRIISKG